MKLVTELEYLVIGAGPAGLQLGYYLEKAHRNYIILEAGDSPGTFFKDFPRHKKLISINKVYTGYDDPEINLRWDWNSLLSDSEKMQFKNYSKQYFPHTDDLVRYLSDFATQFNLKVKYGCKVVKITKNDKFLVVDSNNNTYVANRIIVATGFTQPYIPAIPGIELAENYTEVSTNPEDFINQKVLIIGKGNSGFETADSLIETAAQIHIVSEHPISMAWKTKYVGNLRAVNNNFLDTYQLKSQNAILDASIKKIEHKNGLFSVSFSYSHANGEEETLIYDRVIVCTGFRFDSSIFDESCQPDLTINNRFPCQTSEWESTNVKDLYFAGVLTHMRDFKKKQSGFIHGFRYNVRALHQILEHKYHNQELPYQILASTPEQLVETIIKRVNQSSGLWQQTGFLCDLITISEEDKIAKYYQELPKDYIHESHLGECNHYYTVSLEFGYEVDKMPDPFAINRVHKDDTHNASQSAFIHPIIRRFSGNTLIAEHHVIEDLASEWLEDVHILPLLHFFNSQLSPKNREIQPYSYLMV
ncbi:FAD-dependent pyridine nucleotide-disulphide oxidoreductase [Nostoc sp. NIES-3756]|uniref:NAD(P)-binding domain-containing protein n=1 Tax=Nostoc sp. NIES-3756 TaxID=1751286 RepID=UPI0007222B3C|nr:NAD(P)-binding domain-containing protein [Nostoc sp. NIES-3756]BAT55378.1 FAD-dependent pyridine nucleotide-disulphide oxidoreductase [Nostoc sp. NIES-3756]BAY36843.1 FAD-dependent pyridine nucleotide-disulfide oxidoreductase [Nostoc sp. NIES-2111]